MSQIISIYMLSMTTFLSVVTRLLPTIVIIGQMSTVPMDLFFVIVRPGLSILSFVSLMRKDKRQFYYSSTPG